MLYAGACHTGLLYIVGFVFMIMCPVSCHEAYHGSLLVVVSMQRDREDAESIVCLKPGRR